jgi:MFS family permease
VIFGAITLDLLAVLFGGAMTLLPIYAKDILHVGPAGFGWLRAAPALGAVAIAFVMAHGSPMRRAGRSVLWAVAGFGVTTIIFGFSTWYPLSLVMMIVAGAFDMVSVVIRQTLVQVRTPDVMRGRVSAVNSLFIDTSNQLGGFESGAAAALFGPVISVVGGGIATLLVVAGVARWWPELRDLRELQPPADGAP